MMHRGAVGAASSGAIASKMPSSKTALLRGHHDAPAFTDNGTDNGAGVTAVAAGESHPGGVK